MDAFTNGDFKPQDDPEMATPLPDQPEEPEKEAGKDAAAKDEKSVAGAIEDNKTAEVSSAKNKNEYEVDEFNDKNGLHYKGSIQATSKTPGPPNIGSLKQHRSSIPDLKDGKYHEMSKVSVNFGIRSGSNLSSIVHMEEVSAGYYSIDRQEYRVQKKIGFRDSKMRTSRSSNLQKEEPFDKKDSLSKVNQEDLNNLQKQLQGMSDNPYGDVQSKEDVSKSKKGGIDKVTPEREIEGNLMRASANNLRSAISRLEGGRESLMSQAQLSFRDKDSMLSLFNHIPDQRGGVAQKQTRYNQFKESRRSVGSLSGISKDFTDMFINRQSMAMSEDENSIAIIERDATPNLNKEKNVGLKSRLKKLNTGPTFMKGFAHGFGYSP